MKSGFRLAKPSDLEPILQSQAATPLGQQHSARSPARTGDSLTAFWRESILDRSAILGETDGEVRAAGALDLEQRELGELYVPRGRSSDEWFTRCLVGLERLAVRFGILDLAIVVPSTSQTPFLDQGYRPKPRGNRGLNATAQVELQRSLRRRLDRYGRFVLELSAELGIPPDYGVRHRMACQPEAGRLRSIGLDIHGREQFMTHRAGAAWQRLRNEALRDGVELQAVSAFRSAAYQAELLRRKQAKGIRMDDILRVSAAPGYSEHHSGRAIDITAPGFAALEEEFEWSQAYQWLQLHASALGFRLSFPRGNRHRLAFEPWHWYFEG